MDVIQKINGQSEKRNVILLCSVFAVVLFVVKSILINKYANETPFWDQWDGEAAFLFLPWLEGTLKWSDLIASHNEHRILITRLLALSLLELNGRVWSPILEMRVNTVLHISSLIILLNFLTKTLNFKNKLAIVIFMTIIFSIPFGWENTLSGFQSQFYFLLIFSFLFLWSISMQQIFSSKWWLGLIAGIFSVLSLASGAVTLLAGIVIVVVRYLIEDEKNIKKTILVIGLLLAIGLFAIFSTKHIDGHDSLKAHSVAAFLQALKVVTSWPAKSIFINGVIIYFPAILICIMIFINNKYHRPQYIFILALTVWMVAQSVILAYGRATIPISSRYLDLLLIGLILNFTALIAWFEMNDVNKKSKYFMQIIAVVWVVVVFQGCYERIDEVRESLVAKRRMGMEQQKNVRMYLCTEDFDYLKDKPYQSIPYPNAERLQSLLNNNSIRSILPGNIYESNLVMQSKLNTKQFCIQ